MPFPQVVTLVAPGVYQVRLPLPFALRIVNVYLLQGERGWTVVDTGLNTAESRSTWLTVFDELHLNPRQIEQIVLTHTHPDHYGMAGWLQHLSSAPVYLSPREHELAAQVWGGHLAWRQNTLDFWHRCGMPADLAHLLTADTEDTREKTLPHPQNVQLLPPGSTLRLGDACFEAIHAPGHSDGQLLFYEATEQLLLCGDQILQKISPNISLWPQGEANPLKAYLASLDRLAQLPVRLALPGHGPVITDLPGRMTQLQQHHVERLQQSKTAVSHTPLTVFQAAQQLFDFTKLTSHEVRFAVAETLAHLVFLAAEGQIQCHEAEIWMYYMAEK